MRRWRPRDVSRHREVVAITLNLTGPLLAIGGFALLQPYSDWSDPVLIAALCCVSAIAYLAEARLRFGVLAFYGATFVVAVVAVGVAGPLPALLVWLVPDVISRYVLRREPRLSPGLVATVSSYALAVLVAQTLIDLGGNLAGAAGAPTLYAAGVAMWVVNFTFARLLFAPYYQGIPPSSLIRDEFATLAPTALGMLAVGIVATVLVEAYGVAALVLLAAVICVPQLVLERLVSSRSTGRLDRPAATRLYADAIGDVLGLSRADRRELRCAAGLLEPVGDTRAPEGLGWREADVSRAAFLALHAHEHWSGSGWPAGLPAESIPLGSRILAVADEWAGLTAHGTPEVTHADALLALSAQSGLSFDPAVVDAAAEVVEDERGFAVDPAFQPKLHRLPGPRSLRRHTLPGILPRPLTD